MPQDFLSASPMMTAHLAVVGVTLDRLGALLVADDAGNIIWRVAARSAEPAN